MVVVLGPPNEPAHAIVVEIPHDKSKDPKQLARYATALWLLLRCDVTVLVVCPDQGVAAHYATPVDSGLTGYRLHPHVLGPDNIPRSPTPPRGVSSARPLGPGGHGPRPTPEEITNSRGFTLPNDTRARTTTCTGLIQLEKLGHTRRDRADPRRPVRRTGRPTRLMQERRTVQGALGGSVPYASCSIRTKDGASGREVEAIWCTGTPPASTSS
ncbi:hypothetical protein ACFSTC_02725 [Nonomuraea ferruginea]